MPQITAEWVESANVKELFDLAVTYLKEVGN